jgi:uncharacterized protein
MTRQCQPGSGSTTFVSCGSHPGVIFFHLNRSQISCRLVGMSLSKRAIAECFGTFWLVLGGCGISQISPRPSFGKRRVDITRSEVKSTGWQNQAGRLELRRRMRDAPVWATYLYLQLTLAFSAVIWTLIICSGHVGMGFGLMIPAMMWCPAIAALLACRLLGRDIRSLAWRWPAKKYVLLGYLLPLAYASVAYGMVWAWGLAGWNNEFMALVAQDFGLDSMPSWGSLLLYVTSMATGGVILNLSTALGEEIGWRGFLVPELAKQMSFTKVSLLSGVIWAAWHIPLLLFADYNPGTNRWYALACCSVTVISISFVFTWLRLKSDSIWPPALLHASHNLFVPGVFDHLVRNTGSTLWYTSQFGVALSMASVVLAIYFWIRRDEAQPAAAANLSTQSTAFVSSLRK